jgi:hypothetical protein
MGIIAACVYAISVYPGRKNSTREFEVIGEEMQVQIGIWDNSTWRMIVVKGLFNFLFPISLCFVSPRSIQLLFPLFEEVIQDAFPTPSLRSNCSNPTCFSTAQQTGPASWEVVFRDRTR